MSASDHVTQKSEEQSTALAEPQDLRLELKVKNNVLWHAIYDRYGSVNALCKMHEELKGKGTIIGQLIRFKVYPFKKKQDRTTEEWYYSDEYRSVCLALERVLRIPVEDLFPKHLYDHLIEIDTEKAIEVSSFTALPAAAKQEIRLLEAPGDDPLHEIDLAELKERLKKVFKTLTDREREILTLRFGLDGAGPYTLEEVGAIFGLNKERIRQVEATAVRKLQQPSRSSELVAFV